jgi:predicted amidohydrolase
VLIAAVHLPGSADHEANRRNLVAGIAAAAELGADVVIAPEYANGFRAGGPDASLAEPLDGETVQVLREAATKHDVLVVTGFLATGKTPELGRSLALTITPDQMVVTDKLHRFDVLGAKESDAIERSEITAPQVVSWRGLNFAAMICFDLRFPEVARRLVDAGADAIIVPAAWVAGPNKIEQWETLLAARAIENLSLVAGATLVAPKLIDDCTAYSPLGSALEQEHIDSQLEIWRFDSSLIAKAREANPALELRRFGVTELEEKGAA